MGLLKFRGDNVYQPGGEAFCGPWTVRWNFYMEPFVRDGESSGMGRFVGLVDGLAVVQLWIIPGGIKIEHTPGYAVQIDTENKVITVMAKENPS